MRTHSESRSPPRGGSLVTCGRLTGLWERTIDKRREDPSQSFTAASPDPKTIETILTENEMVEQSDSPHAVEDRTSWDKFVSKLS